MPSDLAIELTSWQAASAGALMNFEDSEIAERARLEAAAAHLAARLRAFEPQYQLSSQEFHRRFSRGTGG